MDNAIAAYDGFNVLIRESSLLRPKELLSSLIHEVMHDVDKRAYNWILPLSGENNFVFEMRARLAVRLITGEWEDGTLPKAVISILNVYNSSYPHFETLWAILWKKYGTEIRPYLKDRR